MDESRFTRRGSLVRLGGLAAGALGVAGLEAASSDGAGPAAVASGQVRIGTPNGNALTINRNRHEPSTWASRD